MQDAPALNRQLHRLAAAFGFGSTSLQFGGQGEKIGQWFGKHNVVLPELVSQYARDAIPSRDIADEGFRWLGADEFVRQNLEFSPALFVRDFGFWTLATLLGGEVFALDVITGRVVQIDPGHFYFKGGKPRFVGKEGTLTREHVHSVAELQSSDLSGFIELLL